MQTTPEISFGSVDVSEADKAYIVHRIDKLNRFCDHITSCSVSLDREQEKADTGDVYRVRVRTHVPPNHELIGEHSPNRFKHEVDLRGALNDAFDNLEVQLRKLNELQNRKSPRS